MITDLCEAIVMKLQPLLCTDKIPIDKNYILRQEDVKQFEEFCDLHIPLVIAEIGLLVGNGN